MHFDFDSIFQTLRNFKRSNSIYLLSTTFSECKKNENIITGDWRTINLELPPFNFPKPEVLIVENCPQAKGLYEDKSLALWRLDDLMI